MLNIINCVYSSYMHAEKYTGVGLSARIISHYLLFMRMVCRNL